MPLYSGTSKSYFFAIAGGMNLLQDEEKSVLLGPWGNGGKGRNRNGKSNLPPMKCRPLKCFTNGLGAERLMSTAGLNLLPMPELGGPSSILHEEGASTEVTGSFVSSRAWMTALKGSRTSPEKLKPVTLCQHRYLFTHDADQDDKPKIASTI